MRLGHNFSGCLQEGLAIHFEVKTILKMIQKSEFIDKDDSQSNTLGIDRPLGGHLSMNIKDIHELFVEILRFQGAQ